MYFMLLRFLIGCWQKLERFIKSSLRDGKKSAHVAFGCTAGKHRSVALAEELGKRIRKVNGIGNTDVRHIDLVRAFQSHNEVKKLQKSVNKMRNTIAEQRKAIESLKQKLEKEKYRESQCKVLTVIENVKYNEPIF